MTNTRAHDTRPCRSEDNTASCLGSLPNVVYHKVRNSTAIVQYNTAIVQCSIKIKPVWFDVFKENQILAKGGGTRTTL